MLYSRKLNTITVVTLIFSIYIYIAAYTYTAWVVNDAFISDILTVFRILLLGVLCFFTYFQHRLQKIDVIFLIFIFMFILTLNNFFIVVSFMLLPALIISNYIFSKRAIFFLLISSLLSFLSILALSTLDIIENRMLIDEGEFVLSNTRHALGFNNPNATAMYVAQILLVSVLCRNILFSIGVAILFLWVTLQTGSRTPLYATIFFLTMLIVCKNIYIQNMVKYTALSVLIMIPFLVVKFVANGNWFLYGIDFNKILTYRLSIMQKLYHDVGGINIFPSYHTEFVDSGYANILLNGGALAYGLLLLFSFSYMRLENDRYYLCLFFTFLLILISETFITGNLLFSILVMARYIFLLKHKI